MKAFVINFNRLTWTKKLCEDLTSVGCEVIIIDNGSTYKPLIDWYYSDNFPYTRYILPNFFGHRSLWQAGLIDFYKDEYYLVTDHDLDISNVPKDFVEVLLNEVKVSGKIKAGLSLELGDLPNNSYTDEVVEWEIKFWQTKNERGFFDSDVDTTLAIYDRAKTELVSREVDNRFFSATRSPIPYIARHLPWYNTPNNLTEEEIYYMNNIRRSAYWTNKFKEHNGINRI